MLQVVIGHQNTCFFIYFTIGLDLIVRIFYYKVILALSLFKQYTSVFSVYSIENYISES